MLRAIQAIRPAATAASRARIVSSSTRAFSVSAQRSADEHHGPVAPQLYGPGNNKPAEALPTDEQQATGIERLQLLGRMEGVDVFDMVPLDASRLGTLADPIKVPSYYPERLVGCTGSPADSHDVIWLAMNSNKKNHRCPECGSVYTLDVQGEQHAHAH